MEDLKLGYCERSVLRDALNSYYWNIKKDIKMFREFDVKDDDESFDTMAYLYDKLDEVSSLLNKIDKSL